MAPRGNPNWKKGVSGNPKGRAPKGRALTDILEKTLAQKVTVTLGDGTIKQVPRKALLAAMVSEAATQGRVTMPDGTVKVVADFADWLALVQFIYKHIDGPPITSLDITSGGVPLPIAIVKMDLDEL